MSEPIVTRSVVAEAADRAAREYVETGIPPANPYPVNSDAAAAWEAAFARYHLQHAVPEAQASA